MINNINEAKKLFLEYGGSLNGIAKDDTEQFLEYKAFNIKKVQEIKWICDYQKEVLDKIINNNYTKTELLSLTISIEEYNSLDVIEQLQEILINSLVLNRNDILNICDRLFISISLMLNKYKHNMKYYLNYYTIKNNENKLRLILKTNFDILEMLRTAINNNSNENIDESKYLNSINGIYQRWYSEFLQYLY